MLRCGDKVHRLIRRSPSTSLQRVHAQIQQSMPRSSSGKQGFHSKTNPRSPLPRGSPGTSGGPWPSGVPFCKEVLLLSMSLKSRARNTLQYPTGLRAPGPVQDSSPHVLTDATCGLQTRQAIPTLQNLNISRKPQTSAKPPQKAKIKTCKIGPVSKAPALRKPQL